MDSRQSATDEADSSPVAKRKRKRTEDLQNE
jgi:hypothetical protein